MEHINNSIAILGLGDHVQLQNQIGNYISSPLDRFVTSVVYAYLKGAASMAMKLIENDIQPEPAQAFISQITIQSMESKQGLLSILPVSPFAFLCSLFGLLLIVFI